MRLLTKSLPIILFLAFIFVLAFLGYKIIDSASVPSKEYTAPIQEVASNSEPLLTKNDVEQIIKAYIIEHPEEIIDSLKKLQQANAQQAVDNVASFIKQNNQLLEDPEIAPFAGNSNGDIRLIAFLDYNCGYCKKANDAINQLLASDVGVKVFYHLHPVLGHSSKQIAKIMLAVHKLYPDKFKKIHDQLMLHERITHEKIQEVIKTNDLDEKALMQEAQKPEITAQLNKTYEIGKNIEISGVPVIILNEHLLPGFVEYEQIKQIINTIRADKPAKGN